MNEVCMLPAKSLALTRLQNELGLFASEDIAGIRVSRVFHHAIFNALEGNGPKLFRIPRTLYGHPYTVDESVPIITAFVIDLRKDKEART
jgi:hypothetical protein